MESFPQKSTVTLAFSLGSAAILAALGFRLQRAAAVAPKGPCASKRAIFPPPARARFDGIHFDLLGRPFKVLFIPNEAAVIIRVPELPGCAQQPLATFELLDFRSGGCRKDAPA